MTRRACFTFLTIALTASCVKPAAHRVEFGPTPRADAVASGVSATSSAAPVGEVDNVEQLCPRLQGVASLLRSMDWGNCTILGTTLHEGQGELRIYGTKGQPHDTVTVKLVAVAHGALGPDETERAVVAFTTTSRPKRTRSRIHVYDVAQRLVRLVAATDSDLIVTSVKIVNHQVALEESGDKKTCVITLTLQGDALSQLPPKCVVR